MVGSSGKKEDFGDVVLQKIAQEKLKSIDAKHVKTLFEVLELLGRAKVKTLAQFAGILKSSRPEVAETWVAELKGKPQEQTPEI